MIRLFVEEDLDGKVNAELDKESTHYLKDVMRIRPDEEFIVVDSGSYENICTFENGFAVIHRRTPNSSEPSVKVCLFQSVSKGERMDLTIQKAVELGVSRVVPVFSSRCVVAPKENRKADRWQKIALEAARQSGRGKVPEIAASEDFATAVAYAKEGFDLILFPWEGALGDGSSLKSCLARVREEGISDIAVFIGPEGGYSEEEAALAKESGASVVTLGPRILRTETAGPAVLAMIMYELEL